MTQAKIETEVKTPPASPEIPPQAQLLQLMFGKHVTYSLSALAHLGVADHMSAAPVPVDELARRVGAHAPSLYRVMRALASVGVFDETSGRRFGLTPVGELLKTHAPGSLRYLATMWGDEWSTRGFENITHCVRTGGDGVTKAYGKHGFDLLAERPDQAENFHRAMTNFSATVSEAVIEAYDFTGIERMADVGGGHGMLLASILKRYPKMQGVLYDLPEVVAGAPGSSHLAGLENRIPNRIREFS
jgi:O-methyltransferase domain